MDREWRVQSPTEVTEELNRLVEIGKLLFSVLTPEEIKSLRIFIEQNEIREKLMVLPPDVELGNTSVT
jgi:hypothetical protein